MSLSTRPLVLRAGMIFVFGTFLLLAGSLGHAFATTLYYVDNICPNNGNGLSQNCSSSPGGLGPFNSIANAQSTVTGDQHGNSLLFKDGETFREQYSVPAHGTSAGQFTIGNYGNGSLPVIKGTNLVTSWKSEELGTKLFYASVGSEPNQVFLDGARLIPVNTKTALVSGDWWWDSTNNRVYIYDNPAGRTVEIGARDYGIYIVRKDYVTVSGVEVEQAEKTGIEIAYSNYSGVANSTADYSFWFGIRLEAPCDGTHDTADFITNDTAEYTYGSSSGYGFGIAAVCGLDNLTVSRNTAAHNCLTPLGAQSSPAYYCSGIDVIGKDDGASTAGGKPNDRPQNAIIEYNVAHDNGISTANNSGQGIWCDTCGDGAQVRYNLAYNNSQYGIYFEWGGVNTGSAVYGNVSYNNFGGLILSRRSQNILVSNNTLVYNTINLACKTVTETQTPLMSKNTLANNLTSFAGSGSGFGSGSPAHELKVSGGCTNDGINGSGNVLEYNGFGAARRNMFSWAGTTYSTYLSLDTVYGARTHSLSGDPVFTNPSTLEFSLEDTSPEINAGMNLGTAHEMGLAPGTSWPSRINLLNQNSHGSGWEIGAYVYSTKVNIKPSPPTSLKAIPH